MDAIILILAWMTMSLVRASAFGPGYDLNWIEIDCGATQNQIYGSREWHTDETFLSEGQGENKIVTINTTLPQMNSLRFFSKGQKNCYKLPVTSTTQMYLFRAGFYYGNYDGLRTPPTFDLYLGDSLWATVVPKSNMDDPIFHELYYTPGKYEISVCLIQSVDGMFPFISSLQMIPLLIEYLYDDVVDIKTAIYLWNRTLFGSDKQVGDLNDPQNLDPYNRIWTPRSMQNYTSIIPRRIPNGYSDYEYDVPWDVLSYAIEANNITDSVYIPIEFPLASSPFTAYFVFLFSSVDSNSSIHTELGIKRNIQIEIDGQRKQLVNISQTYGILESAVVYPVTVNGPTNVTISAAQGTELPPMINAMEVYTTIHVSSRGNYTTCNDSILVVLLVLALVLSSSY